MTYTFDELRTKEVINVVSGERLGFVTDVTIAASGKVLSISVPGGYKALGIFGRRDDITIPWEQIKKIGDDIILINEAEDLISDNII